MDVFVQLFTNWISINVMLTVYAQLDGFVTEMKKQGGEITQGGSFLAASGLLGELHSV